MKGPRTLVKEPRKFFNQIARLFRPMPRDYRKRFGMNLRQWLLMHHRDIVYDKCYWMGARALKNPFDAWIYQEIIYEIKPDVIVEIGSAEGGGALYFANLLDIIGKGLVISIDIDRSKYKVKHTRILEITGDSASPDTFAKVSEICRGKSVIVFHDGDHSKEGVLRDLRLYSKVVNKGSYVIVEDGIVDLFRPGDGLGTYVEGPLAAVEAFLKENTDFIVDKERERYILTYNPKGFLRRVR